MLDSELDVWSVALKSRLTPSPRSQNFKPPSFIRSLGSDFSAIKILPQKNSLSLNCQQVVTFPRSWKSSEYLFFSHFSKLPMQWKFKIMEITVESTQKMVPNFAKSARIIWWRKDQWEFKKLAHFCEIVIAALEWNICFKLTSDALTAEIIIKLTHLKIHIP